MDLLTFGDHLLAAGLALMSVQLGRAQLKGSPLDLRPRFYLSAIVSSMILSGAVIGVWLVEGRALGDFGLFGWLGDSRNPILAGALWVLLLAAWVLLVRRGFARTRLLSLYEPLRAVMPSTRRELAASWTSSLFAGCGEEIVYRGFLLWYATALTGPVAGLLLSSLLFGLSHGYQSRRGMVFATLAGLALGAIYLASESLALVMWAHATYNMASFYLGTILLRRSGAMETQPA